MSALTTIDFYHFVHISVTTNSDYVEEIEGHSSNLDYEDLDVTIDQQIFDDHSVFMAIDIKTQKEKEKHLPIAFSVGALGRFVSPKLERSDFLENMPLILEACADFLFGAVREKITGLTTQMPFGAVYLPLLEIEFDPADEPPTLLPAQTFWDDLEENS